MHAYHDPILHLHLANGNRLEETRRGAWIPCTTRRRVLDGREVRSLYPITSAFVGPLICFQGGSHAHIRRRGVREGLHMGHGLDVLLHVVVKDSMATMLTGSFSHDYGWISLKRPKESSRDRRKCKSLEQSRLSAWVNNGNGEKSSSFISTLISCIKPPRNMLTGIALLPSSFDVE